MIRTAAHIWRTTPSPGFAWTEDSTVLPEALREALESCSGLCHAGQNGATTEWAVQVVNAAGLHWHVLTRVEPQPALSEGRVNRAARHLVLQHPLAGAGPARVLLDDVHHAVGGEHVLGDDAMSTDIQTRIRVDWTACGGDWSEAIAARVRAGEPVRAVLPATHSALDWWAAIEASCPEVAWNRTVLLERVPAGSPADVVLAVDGSACATQLRGSGNAILDLARTPAEPPEGAAAHMTARAAANPGGSAPVVLEDVVLEERGLSAGLALLTLLAVGLIVAAAFVIWSSASLEATP